MIRVLCFLSVFLAIPILAAASDFPNKPGKKPAARLVVGAQAGATTAPPQEVVIGAGSSRTQSGGGDFGLISPTPLKRAAPKRSVGYDPSLRLGNKQPNS